MVINIDKCVGCASCEAACRMENATPSPLAAFNRVWIGEIGQYPNARMIFLPFCCHHCRNPNCLSVCPTGATYKRPDGLVLIDEDKCIGCGKCVIACPYGARQILRRKASYYAGNEPTPYETAKQNDTKLGTAVKCNFCVHRLEAGLKPACVVTCPAQARTFGDFDDPQSDVSIILKTHRIKRRPADLKSEPAIYYVKKN
jgi:molybdopterin-containing oxidoreductase family iron-sulfur binding subunit